MPSANDKQALTWVDQLNDAARGTLTSHGNGKASLGPERPQCNDSRGEPLRKAEATEEQGNGLSQKISYPFGKTDAHDEGLILNSASIKSSTTTPPKKMLRVRSNGKLSSPKSQGEAIETRAKRPGRPKRRSEIENDGVVIIRYGKRKKTRIILGRKIAAVLSAPQAVIHGAVTPKVIDKPSTVPGKPTHPFFTAGITRGPEKTKSASKESAHLEQELAAPKLASPKNLRVNSKPPRLDSNPDANVFSGFPAFGSDHARITRFPGAQEPIWPPLGMVHIRSPSNVTHTSVSYSGQRLNSAGKRKLKEAQINIPADEEVMQPLTKLAYSIHCNRDAQRDIHAERTSMFRRPLRHIMSGCELQNAIRPRILHALPIPISGEENVIDELGAFPIVRPAAPPSLNHLYEGITTGQSAFDKFEWESQNWAQKYAPKIAEHVLQQGREVMTIRDWLRSLTVTSVGTQNAPALANKQLKFGKKKRRRERELEGFLVSSDEEAAEMASLSDSEELGSSGLRGIKKTVIRTSEQADIEPGYRASHAIVMSGPNGCGKSAAIYAVAQELGFGVFEINAGSRRSGKDITDKVGDMTRNHLVRNEVDVDQNETARHIEDLERIDEKLQQDLASGRQGTMKSFFQSKGSVKRKQPSTECKSQDYNTKPRKPQRKSKSQKQSLILLEEVDVLFEEDKMFWMTVLDLIMSTRRPVIMTCTDERLLPIDDMKLFGIFRFSPCPAQLATDYMLLLACSEGHLLERDAVSALYTAKAYDLRASLTELQFFCQMAVGDRKGGLEWMLLDSDPPRDRIKDRAPLRVVSEQTYYKGLGWLGGESRPASLTPTIEHEVEISFVASNMWDVDTAETGEFWAPRESTRDENATADALKQLQELDLLLEVYSLADVFPTCELRQANMAPLDTTQPALSEKTCGQYVEGIPLLQVETKEDLTGLTPNLALTLRASAARLANTHSKPELLQGIEHDIVAVISQPSRRSYKDTLTQESMLSAFDPIARSQTPVLGIPKGAQISSLDRPVSTIAEDLAPYIRSIVSYDLRLEEQRRQLEAALTQPGKNGKKTRKTRASRAALEGGSKAFTRRERWFPKYTNFDSVLQTGGKGWQEVALSVVAMDRPGLDSSTVASMRSTPASSMGDELQ